MGKADLHIHTTASDGRMKPEEVVKSAKEHKLDIIAITDHDTISGYCKAVDKADELGVRLLSGAEVTADFNGSEAHLLAYCFDPDHQGIKKMLLDHHHSRLNRAKWIIKQLAKKGFDLTINEVKAEAGGGNVGRPHIAQVLIKKGYVSSFKAAFIRYLSDDSLGRIYNEYYPHHKVIETVKKAGGATVIAHPANLYDENELELLVEAGVDGIEFIHPSHNYKKQKVIERFAEKHDLLMTGGSDYHGGDTDYKKNFGVVAVHSKFANKLIGMTDNRKKIMV